MQDSKTATTDQQTKSSRLAHFFEPNSIAVVGASPTEGKLGRVIVENLLGSGFAGKMYAVNPNFDQVLDLKCYHTYQELPESPDLAVIVIRASLVEKAIVAAHAKGTKDYIVISAGFKEIGGKGEELEDRLSDLVRELGIRIVGPNCLGIFDNISKVDTFFVPKNLIHRPSSGGVSIASQSGSFVGHFLDLCNSERLGIARVITYGNSVDVGESDALFYLADDSATKIVGLYIEGVKSGKRFLEAAEYCTRRKPLVILKTGKYESISGAIASHTGALAGSYVAYSSAFRKVGAVEVSSIDEFLDVCKVLSKSVPAKGSRVLIVGQAGGLGLTLADHCIENGLELPHLPDSLTSFLGDLVVPYASLANPIDLTASGTDEHTRIVFEKCLAEDNFVDIGIYVGVWGLPQNTDEIGTILSDVSKKSGKPILVASLHASACIERRDVFENRGLPVFMSLERAAAAARHLAEYSLGCVTLTPRNKHN